MKTVLFFTTLTVMAFAPFGYADTTTTTTSTTKVTAASQLSDQQIAQILKTANDAEITAAKVANSRSKDSEVKDFAKHMIADHTKNNKMAKSVEKRTDITPIASANSKSLQKDADAKGTELKGADKSDFDRTYIDQQVAMHTQLLKDLDGTYIPQTQNAEMKAFLEQTRMHVQKHLEMAQTIQAKLEGETNRKAVTQ